MRNDQNMAYEKISFRKELLEIRQRISRDLIEFLSSKIRDRISDFLKDRASTRVFAYADMRGEPALLQLAETVLKDRFYLPISSFDERSLRFYPWSLSQELSKNKYGILEPSDVNRSPIVPTTSDIILVPSLALTLQGDRLGYGGGFYDRLLSESKALTVGVVYDFFILESLPVQSHDIRVNMIISDKRTITTKETQIISE